MASMEEFPMHRAARDGDLKRVKHLIKRGVSVDSRDRGYYTPLHWAVKYGRYEVAELLILNHSDVNLKNRDGRTPALDASLRGYKNIFDLLVKYGAQVNCTSIFKWTPLHWASGHGWVDAVQRIVESGEADLNAAMYDGLTPLMFTAVKAREDVAVLLIRFGADVHHSDYGKQTALHMFSLSGCTRVVQVLLEEEGLDINPQIAVKHPYTRQVRGAG